MMITTELIGSKQYLIISTTVEIQPYLSTTGIQTTYPDWHRGDEHSTQMHLILHTTSALSYCLEEIYNSAAILTSSIETRL